MLLLPGMKKFGIILFAFLAVTTASCFAPHDSDHPVYAALATVRMPDPSAAYFHFDLDNGQTLYPGNRSRIATYDPVGCDGKRAVISFNLLPTPVSGYDLNAVLYQIDPVLTGNIGLVETYEEAAAYGDDPLEVINVWVSGGWLNLLCNLPQQITATPTCQLALVDNRFTSVPFDLPADYRYLEVRYVLDSPASDMERQYASFCLGNYEPTTEGIKGICLRYRAETNHIVYLQIDFPDTIDSQDRVAPALGLFP